MTEKQPIKSWGFLPNIIYEFTVNGCDNVQMVSSSFKTLDLRYKRNRKLLRDILSEGLMKYSLAPEISMPQHAHSGKNDMPRIHFHGLIRFPDEKSILQWLLVDSVKMCHYGSYQFNIFRPEYWPGYCTKNLSLFAHLPGNYILENSFEFEKIWDGVSVVTGLKNVEDHSTAKV